MNKNIDPDTTIRATRLARKSLGIIAQRLFEEYPKGHKELKIKVPSIKIAVDYILYMHIAGNESKKFKYDFSKNMYRKLTEAEGRD